MLTQRSSLSFGGLIGFVVGGFVGFLFRPAVFIAGQLPLEHVLSRGSTLQGLDQMLIPVAQQSFNIALGCAIVGSVLGVIVSLLITRPYFNDADNSLTFSTEWAGIALSILTFVGIFLPLVVLSNIPNQSREFVISIFSLGTFVTLLALLLSLGIGLCWMNNQPKGVIPLSLLLLLMTFVVLFVEAGKIPPTTDFSLIEHISAGFYLLLVGASGSIMLSFWKTNLNDLKAAN